MTIVERDNVKVEFDTFGKGLFTSQISDADSNHNLHQLARHALFDIDIKEVQGSGEIAKTMELVGECIGTAYKKELPPDSEILAASLWPFQGSIGFSIIDQNGVSNFKSDLPPEDSQVIESLYRGFSRGSDIPLSGLGIFARRPSLRGYTVMNESEILTDMQSTHHLREALLKTLAKTLRGGIDSTMYTDYTDVASGQLPANRAGNTTRKTSEVVAQASVNLDSYSEPKVRVFALVDRFSVLPVFSEYLKTFAIHSKHGLDINTDKADEWHHEGEDIKIILGQAYDIALGEKRGVRRVGWTISNHSVNGEELAVIAGVDLSGEGRGYPELFVPNSTHDDRYKHEMMHHFLSAFANTGKMDIVLFVGFTNHPFYREFVSVAGGSMSRLKTKYGLPDDYPYKDAYDLGSAALGRAIGYATKYDPRSLGVIPSTKGTL